MPTPYGLAPYQYLSGAPWDGKTRAYTIAPNYATSIFWGDPVVLGASGYIQPWVPGTSSTIPPLGVFCGCKYIPMGQALANAPTSYEYYPGSVAIQPGSPVQAMIMDDPNIIMKLVTSNGSYSASACGINSNIAFTPGTGNTQTGSSVASLNVATFASTATLPLKVVGTPLDNLNRVQFPQPAGQEMLCVWNSHYYKPGTAPAGA